MTRESLPSKCGPPLRALNCKLHIYYCNGIKNKQLYIYKLSFEEQIMCLRSFECFIALFFTLSTRVTVTRVEKQIQRQDCFTS